MRQALPVVGVQGDGDDFGEREGLFQIHLVDLLLVEGLPTVRRVVTLESCHAVDRTGSYFKARFLRAYRRSFPKEETIGEG